MIGENCTGSWVCESSDRRSREDQVDQEKYIENVVRQLLQPESNPWRSQCEVGQEQQKVRVSWHEVISKFSRIPSVHWETNKTWHSQCSQSNVVKVLWKAQAAKHVLRYLTSTITIEIRQEFQHQAYRKCRRRFEWRPRRSNIRNRILFQTPKKWRGYKLGS